MGKRQRAPKKPKTDIMRICKTCRFPTDKLNVVEEIGEVYCLCFRCEMEARKEGTNG